MRLSTISPLVLLHTSYLTLAAPAPVRRSHQTRDSVALCLRLTMSDMDGTNPTPSMVEMVPCDVTQRGYSAILADSSRSSDAKGDSCNASGDRGQSTSSTAQDGHSEDFVESSKSGSDSQASDSFANSNDPSASRDSASQSGTNPSAQDSPATASKSASSADSSSPAFDSTNDSSPVPPTGSSSSGPDGSADGRPDSSPNPSTGMDTNHATGSNAAQGSTEVPASGDNSSNVASNEGSAAQSGSGENSDDGSVSTATVDDDGQDGASDDYLLHVHQNIDLNRPEGAALAPVLDKATGSSSSALLDLEGDAKVKSGDQGDSSIPAPITSVKAAGDYAKPLEPGPDHTYVKVDGDSSQLGGQKEDNRSSDAPVEKADAPLPDDTVATEHVHVAEKDKNTVENATPVPTEGSAGPVDVIVKEQEQANKADAVASSENVPTPSSNSNPSGDYIVKADGDAGDIPAP